MSMETDRERLARIKNKTGGIYSMESDSVESKDVPVEDFDWLIEQAEQTESFKKLHKTYLDRYVDAVGERNEFFEENDRLRRALEFYADDATYETNVTDQWEPITPVAQDKGKKAKKALEGEQWWRR